MRDNFPGFFNYDPEDPSFKKTPSALASKEFLHPALWNRVLFNV